MLSGEAGGRGNAGSGVVLYWGGLQAFLQGALLGYGWEHMVAVIEPYIDPAMWSRCATSGICITGC